MTTTGRNNTLRLGALVALLLLSLAIAGCGSSSSSGSADGAQVFTDNCVGCHTLKAAGAKGTTGPDLDKSKSDAAKVKDRVTNGKGAMPALKGKLSTAEIEAVSNYVATNAGK